MQQADVLIIGGGIVGLATAYTLVNRYPDRSVLVLEKEPEVARHQTSHNSGVLHTGIYYRPGSLKATNCRAGKQRLEAFCREEEIAFDICGKVIVAVDDQEVPALQTIYQRGQENGIDCRLIGHAELRELEPHAAGIQAIHVREAGIVDYRQVCERLAQRTAERGGRLVCSAQVTKIIREPNQLIVESTAGEFAAQYLVNCAGLHCDRVTRLTGATPQAQVVPFRGEYYELTSAAEHLCNHLIYPIPDPEFPFLGVHFTRMIAGGVECGPNAVLAFGREGYRKTDVELRDLAETLTYPGFLRMAMKYWRTGCAEMWRSLSKAAFVRGLQRLVPAIESQHLVAAPAGVRAQAVLRDGRLVDDFLIRSTDRVVNVENAPSPAATSSLNIGQYVVDRLTELQSSQ